MKNRKLEIKKNHSLTKINITFYEVIKIIIRIVYLNIN